MNAPAYGLRASLRQSGIDLLFRSPTAEAVDFLLPSRGAGLTPRLAARRRREPFDFAQDTLWGARLTSPKV